MEITVNIVNRNYEQIKEFCELNKIKIEDYITQCVEDDFFTRKYGDLNQKLNINSVKEKSPTEVLEKTVNEISEYKNDNEIKTQKLKSEKTKKVKQDRKPYFEEKIENEDEGEDITNEKHNKPADGQFGQTKIRTRKLRTIS